MVANAVSRLRILDLYQDNGNEDVPPTVDDVIKNIKVEVHTTDVAPKRPVYNMGKLNLNVLRKEQQWDLFGKNEVKELKVKPDPNFLLGNKSILRKVVRLKYSVELTIVVPRKLTFLIIVEFSDTKRHQGINYVVKLHYDFSPNRTFDCFKTSFPLLLWTSSGLRTI